MRTTERPDPPQDSLELFAVAESPFNEEDIAVQHRPDVSSSTRPPQIPVTTSLDTEAFPPLAHPRVSANKAPDEDALVVKHPRPSTSVAASLSNELQDTADGTLRITPVGHRIGQGADNGGTITIDGRTFVIRLVDEDQSNSPRPSVELANRGALRPLHFATLAEVTHQSQGRVSFQGKNVLRPTSHSPFQTDVSVMPPTVEESTIIPPNATLMNLPTALSMVGGKHPAVGLAQWKVQEAYADLEQAETLWLPSIRVGFSFHKHDGNYQASNGDIVDVNRSSLQFGMGAGATGAGTTPMPGLSAQFHLADAIFAPEIAQKTAWATCHAEKAAVNLQLRDVALAYVDLLKAHQRLRILQEVNQRTNGLAKITNDFANAGQGLQADADRMQTELKLLAGRIAEARENVDVMSARLAHALSVDSGQDIIPMDPMIAPIELVSMERDKGALISNGLAARPELKELQALVAAACNRYQRQKFSPFVPSVLLGLSAGGFGGDTGNAINSVDDRYDFDAMVTWEIRNLGFGERSARRRSEAQVQQAMLRKVKLIDDVARQISEAHSQVVHRRERMAVTQQSIQSAMDSYDRNLSRIRDGEGLPIEVLLSVKALEAAQLAYLESVVAFNQAQFQLQWALGWQVSAPPENG